MENYRVIQIKENVLAKNDREADKVRQELKEHKAYLVNVMSSPGSGKTTLLCNLIPKLQKKGLRIGVMEADIDGEVDADTVVKKTGCKAIQVHTGGECHLTAQMTKDSLEALGMDGLDLIFLENIGNLVCPAEFDTGANKNMELLSVPEGDDKPLKYPLMFEVADIVVVTKVDTSPVFDFDFDVADKRFKERNPEVEIFHVSAKKDTGVDALADYLFGEVKAFIGK